MKRSANKYRTPKAQENIRELEKQLSFKERLFSILAFKRGINRLSKWTLIVVLSLAAIVGLTYIVRCIFDSAYGSEIQNVNYTSKHNILSKQQVMHMLGISDDTDLDSLPIDASNRCTAPLSPNFGVICRATASSDITKRVLYPCKGRQKS